MRRFAFLPVVVVGIVGPIAMGACSTAALVPAGGECLLATDCEPGLACVPSNGKRVCSADLSGIASGFEAGGGDATPTEAGRDAVGDAPVADVVTKDQNNPPPDTGAPDTGTPDTGAPDTGSSDAGGGG